jgi:hypothetical protein
MGTATLWNNTTGSQNIAIGHTALLNNIANSGNIAIGYMAMYNSDDGTTGTTKNVAIGNLSMQGGSFSSLSTGINNARVGGITIEEFYCHSNCHGSCHGSL